MDFILEETDVFYFFWIPGLGSSQGWMFPCMGHQAPWESGAPAAQPPVLLGKGLGCSPGCEPGAWGSCSSLAALPGRLVPQFSPGAAGTVLAAPGDGRRRLCRMRLGGFCKAEAVVRVPGRGFEASLAASS